LEGAPDTVREKCRIALLNGANKPLDVGLQEIRTELVRRVASSMKFRDDVGFRGVRWQVQVLRDQGE
jgi:hypothetical protein